MHLVFSSNHDVAESGYYAKIHTSEAEDDCSTQTTTAKTKTTNSYCYYPDYQGDNICDDENNNANCDYDGGDCCGDEVDTSYCSQCQCLDPSHSTTTPQSTMQSSTSHQTTVSSSGCGYPGYKGDNYCDDENNNANCDYDGGDCCGDNVDTSYCTQCQCIDPAFTTTSTTTVTTSTSSAASYYEAEGLESKESTHHKVAIEPMLCPGYNSIGNGICDQANDNLVCYFDGGDCSLGGNTTNCISLECFDHLKFDPCPKFEKIGNHQCDKENFNIICSFDAGDCQTG